MLNKMITKAAEIKKNFEDDHGVVAYATEFIISVGLTFTSSFVAAKVTRQAINKIAQWWKVGKVGSFILSVMIGFIPAFIGSFVSALTMPNERVLKAGIINRERDRKLSGNDCPTDIMDNTFKGEEA